MADIIARNIVLMGLDDIKFTPEGGASADIPGAMSLEIALTGDTYEAKGDDGLIAYGSSKSGAKITVSSCVLSLSAKAALLGDTVVEAGTSPAKTVTLEVKKGFTPTGVLRGRVMIIKKFQGDTLKVPQDAWFEIELFSVDASSFTDGLKIGEHHTQDFSGMAIPDANGIIYKIIYHETATSLG